MALTPFQRSTALGAVVLLLSLVQVTYSISCLSCGEDGKEQLSQCNGIKDCGDNHACYIEQFISEQHGYQARYRAGCRDLHECNLVRCNTESFRNTSLVTKHPRQHSKRDDLVICSECCYNDTCNVEGCGANFSDSAVKQCFHCPMLREYSPICDTFKQCVTDTMSCATILHVHDNGNPYYELKCLEEKFCDILYELAEQSHKEPTTRCCKNHLCNQNPYKVSNTTSSIEQYLACPTGLVQTFPTTTATTTPKPTTTTTTSKPTTSTTTPIPTTTTPEPTTTPTTQATPTTPTTQATSTTPTTQAPTTAPPTQAPTTAPPTKAPSTAPPTQAHTTAPPTQAPNTAPPTQAPTTAPPTQAPTTAPTTQAPTTAPPTQALTTAPTPKLNTTTPTITNQSSTIAPSSPSQDTPPIPVTSQSPSAAPVFTDSVTCKVCAGPLQFCEVFVKDAVCTYPNNYCINHLTNERSGKRTVDRKCGDADLCMREFFYGTSDNDRCTTFDPTYVKTLDFECTFCCKADNCNAKVVPDKSTWFTTS